MWPSHLSKRVESFDPVTLLTRQLTFSVILSAILLLVTATPLLFLANNGLLVVSSGILQYFLAFFLYLHVLRWAQANIAGVMLYLMLIIALLLSWLSLNEMLSSIQASGIGITIASIYLLNKKYQYE